jgi:ribosomal 50S subunit-associated protein YjgA (DUF615 family)
MNSRTIGKVLRKSGEWEKKKGISAGDVAMTIVIKAYSHQSLKQLCRESEQEEKTNK